MGNSESALRAAAVEAEGVLLRSGLDFATTRPDSPAGLSVTAFDVPLSADDTVDDHPEGAGVETLRTALWTAPAVNRALGEVPPAATGANDGGTTNGAPVLEPSARTVDVLGSKESSDEVDAARAAVAAAQYPPIVLVHGYGAGLGFYSHSAPLLARPGQPVLAVDMPGCGLSSRPPNTFGTGPTADIDGAHAYFSARLDGWRRSLGIDKMVLVGHSLGGYVAATYAERYPSALDRLVLASCVGLPDRPAVAATAEGHATPRPQPGLFRRSMYAAWDRGWSPMALARWGPGASLLGGYVDRRFPDRAWVDKPALKAYLHSSWFGGPGGTVGEQAHSIFLHPGAFARRPLHRRLAVLDPGLRVTFIYGHHDWMDWRHAAAVDERCRADNASSGAAVRPATEIAVLDSAGHQLMVDNAPGFAELVALSATEGAVHGIGINR